MEILGINITTANDDQARWVVNLKGDVTLSLQQARDLAKVLQSVAADPEAMHREPLAEPTFCEGGKV